MRGAAVWISCLTMGVLGFAWAQQPQQSAPPPAPGAAPSVPPPATPQPPPRAMSPEELRSRERAVILALQTMMLAERTYATHNGGLFGDLPCLTDPYKCLPNYSKDGATFLDPTYDWLETRLEYARAFHAGPRATADELRNTGAAPGSLKAWAYTTTPLFPGLTGTRGLCCDSRGRICMTEDGRQPPVKDGLCEPCKKLQ